MDDDSKELKEAMREIDVIVKKYDINAAVFLADGLGNGEFSTYFDKPSWSMLKYLSTEVAHTKMHRKTRKYDTERTVNSMIVLDDMLCHIKKVFGSIIDTFESAVKIDRDEPKIKPRKE